MADFCLECSKEVWGKDTGDLAGLCPEDKIAEALCEGCNGWILVDHKGLRVHRYRIIEEREGDTDVLLASHQTQEIAEHWLCFFLTHDHDAYLVDSEEAA